MLLVKNLQCKEENSEKSRRMKRKGQACILLRSTHRAVSRSFIVFKHLLMELYALYFACLALINAAIAYSRQKETKHDGPNSETIALPSGVAGKQEAKRFKLQYFTVYALVMAADWLQVCLLMYQRKDIYKAYPCVWQGPYMYTLYKDEKSLGETVVAALFTTGFVSAGICASFVGTLADQHGRKKACLTFCVAYLLSCLSVLSDDLLILFAGRALGGLSTTLLYSVFETWMLSEYSFRELHESM